MDEPLVVIGAGGNGIAEMQDMLDDAAVQWALIRFELGSGAFCRKKFLFLHLNGEETPAVRRGQANAYTAEAQRLLRADNQEGFHASLAVTRKEDVTEEQLLARVGHFFVKDDIDYSVQLERQDTKTLMSKAPKAPALKGESPGFDARGKPTIPGHQSVMPFSSGRDALQAVAEPFGRWNWVMVRPDPESLELVTGGTGSIDEMRECLRTHEEEVLSGLLRLGFGAGRLRRTKHVFVHAVGERVPVVSRGRMAAARPLMEATLGKLVHCSVTMELTQVEDLTLEGVIERVRRAAIIDDVVLDGDSPTRSVFSVEAFRDALKEEYLAQAPAPPVETGGNTTQWQDRSVADVVKLVHAPNGPLNWALFGPNLARMRARVSLGSGLTQPSAPTGRSTHATPAGGFTAARLRANTSTF